MIDKLKFSSESVVDDKTYYKNIKRLRRTLQAAAEKDTPHLNWVDKIPEGRSINDHINAQIDNFVKNLTISPK